MTIEYKKYNRSIIKVLCVNLEGSIAGAEQSFLLFVRFVPKTIQISVACPAGVLTEKLRSLGIRTYQISSPPRSFNNLFAWFFYLTIVNLYLFVIVFKTRPQIIHANSTKAVLAVALAKVLAGSKLIWHARDLKCSRLLVRICDSLSSKVIVVSGVVKNRLISLGVRPELTEVIHNGIVTNNIRTREKNQSGSFVFANIGQFVPWKKQLLFLEAAEKFLEEGYKANFILVGDDIFGRDKGYKNELTNKVRISPFARNIKIIGWQDGLDSAWPKIDCLIHTADAEPFGRVIIEAMVHGIPIITATGGGPAEIITNHKTGLFFAPDDIDGLLVAMKAISGDRKMAHNLALNGRQHVISNFQAKRTAEKISKVYKELIAA